MTKIVINNCYGGFSLSKAGTDRLAELIEAEAIINRTDKSADEILEDLRHISRADPLLVQVVEELGSRAGGRYSQLIVVDVPKDSLFCIREYDGLEHVECMEQVKWLVA